MSFGRPELQHICKKIHRLQTAKDGGRCLQLGFCGRCLRGSVCMVSGYPVPPPYRPSLSHTSLDTARAACCCRAFSDERVAKCTRSIQNMARAKLAPKQPVVKHPVQSFLLHTVELLECPLCIETLDATDKDFWPCPCGYQVCLFCYQRLQNEYNNTCPGCRQQYSDDLDGVRQHIARKQQQQQRAESSGTRLISGGSSQAGTHHAAHHHAAHLAHHGVAAQSASRSKMATASGKHHALFAEGTAHGRGTVMHSTTEANGNLPVTASWAVASASSTAAVPCGMEQQPTQHQEASPLSSTDDAAWPTLGAYAVQQQLQPPKSDSGQAQERRRSSSSSLTTTPHHQQTAVRTDPARSSFESTASSFTPHSDRQHRHQHQQLHDDRRSDSDVQSQAQEPEQQQQQQQQPLERNSSGFTTVEVSTVVSGKRHDVCVHVSHAEEVRVYPEAAELLDVLRQAVQSNKLSSTEAAVQLVQCLRKLEADSSNSNSSKQVSWLQQVLPTKLTSSGTTLPSSGRPPLASRAPPPGFGSAAAHRAGGPAAFTGVNGHHQYHTQQQQEPHPAGWNSAHRGVASQQPTDTPQGSMHSVDSTNSLFSQGSSLSQSVWTDCGLPGVDLGVGVTRLAGGLVGTSHASAVPAQLQMLWGNGSSAGNGLGCSSSTVAGPPPGFGAPTGNLGLGSRLHGMYNPLSFANAGAAQQSSNGLPPGFGLSAGNVANDGFKQQQQQQQQLPSSLYQPF